MLVETTDSEPVCSEFIPNNDNATPDVEKSILAQFAENPRCPKCKSHNVGRWGIRNGRQRYHCKSCDSTLNAFSGTSLARLRHPEKWNKYLTGTGMTHSMVLRPAAAENAIDLKTAFRWRHRFLEVINNDQAEELCGITELDETPDGFFSFSVNLCRGWLASASVRDQLARILPVW